MGYLLHDANHVCVQVLELISHKVDVLVEDKEGMTALHLAAHNNHVGVLKALADAGGLDLLSKKCPVGKTALEHAVFNGRKEAEEVLRQAQESKTQALEQQQQLRSSCRHLAEEMTARYDPEKEDSPVTKEEFMEIVYNIELELSALSARGSDAHRDRFVADPRDLVCGEFEHAAKGYFKLLNVPEVEVSRRALEGVAAIEEEVRALGDTDVSEHLHYILKEPAKEKRCANGVRDKGHEGMVLQDFVEHQHSRTADLDKAEVVALRLYTTPAFRQINDPLRDQARISSGTPHPLPVTVMLIARGIKKLRTVDATMDAGTQSVVL
jgi:hypothetical protein